MKKRRGTINKYQFPGIKCKIEGCSSPVFMSKTVGLCCKHKGRSETGRMLDNGELAPLIKTKNCKSCGAKMFIKGKANGRRKYCDNCQEIERRKVQKENNNGFFRTSPRPSTTLKHNKKVRKQYIWHLMNLFIAVGNPSYQKYTRKNIERRSAIIAMRETGATFRDIGMHFGITGERVRQIIR